MKGIETSLDEMALVYLKAVRKHVSRLTISRPTISSIPRQRSRVPFPWYSKFRAVGLPTDVPFYSDTGYSDIAV